MAFIVNIDQGRLQSICTWVYLTAGPSVRTAKWHPLFLIGVCYRPLTVIGEYYQESSVNVNLLDCDLLSLALFSSRPQTSSHWSKKQTDNMLDNLTKVNEFS